MQSEKISEVRVCIQKAANDLRGADINLNVSPPLIEDALVHCQQVAEKAMKGFLTMHDKIFPKTHDLDELASLCEEVDSSLENVLEKALDLTVFAWIFRFPGDMKVPSKEEALQYLSIARQVYDSILSRLPKEVSPDS